MDLLTEIQTLKADYKAASDLLEASAAQVEQYKQAAEAAAKNAQDALQALSAKDSAISTLLAEIEAYKGQISALQATQKTAEEKAVAIVATQGVAPMAVQPEVSAKLTSEQALAEFASLTTAKARADYYATNRALLIGK